MLKSSFSYAIDTMGCKANLTDSQALESRLQGLGGVLNLENPDVYVLNTCTVTDQADKEAMHTLRKTSAPLMIATGCLAQVSPESLLKNKEVVVVRNSGKDELETVIQDWLAKKEQASVVHGNRVEWHQKILPNENLLNQMTATSARTRAFYKVQDGCNAFCTYCVIPLARGRSRSLSPEQIIADIRLLVDQGVKELNLTAIHAADYDHSGLSFDLLVEKIISETKIQRLRLTSLDPAEISDRLLALMKNEPRLCPHIHVSVQAASSSVLNRMKRNYDASALELALSKIARELPHAYVGLDLIAGCPGETEEEFSDGLQRLEQLPWTRAHVFPYSVRRNTVAARLVESGQAVPVAVIHNRARLLRDLSTKKMGQALSKKVGTICEVLVEAKMVTVGTRQCSQGHARNFHKVLLPGQHKANSLLRTRIVGVGDKETLKGELL